MDLKMNVWSKYKNYIFTSITSIKTVHVISENKTYFCFDDMMSLIGYKLDENGSVNREVANRYFNRLKMQNFIEIYPNNLFVSVDNIKNLPSIVGLLANSPIQQTNLNSITVKLLRSFIESFKNRKEEIIEDNTEDFIKIRNRFFSVATYKNKTVIKASDILRYCGYKNTKVPDNFKEYSVKINTKNGISNFVYLEKFPSIANEMANSKYANKMNSLFIADKIQEDEIQIVLVTISPENFGLNVKSNGYVKRNFVRKDEEISFFDVLSFAGGVAGLASLF